MVGMLRDGKQMIKIGAREVKAVDSKTKEIGVIFNNNSGGDAAENALALQKILNIKPDGLNPTQMDLF